MSVETRGQRVKINGVLTDVTYQDTVAREQLDSVKRMIYPVGSIYISVTETSPAALFGGTWEQLKDKFLLAAGDTYAAGSTGGEAQHKLTINEMPVHNHCNQYMYYDSGQKNGFGVEVKSVTDDNYIGKRISPEEMKVGGDNSHNNMPPYVAVYMWKRVS